MCIGTATATKQLQEDLLLSKSGQADSKDSVNRPLYLICKFSPPPENLMHAVLVKLKPSQGSLRLLYLPKIPDILLKGNHGSKQIYRNPAKNIISM